MKLCSSEFSLKDLSDVYRHLSNYTIQKKNTESNLSSDFFVKSAEELEEEIGNGFRWEEDMLPKIKDVVYKTLKGVQESQSADHKTRCFEIYGFDFVLDKELNPWVIEVNLSPACSERAPFLTQMLDDMAFDMIHWLERRILTSSGLVEAHNMTEGLVQKR